MNIAEVTHRQLPPPVGNLDIGVMDLMALSSPSNNSMTIGGQIRFGRLLVFDNLGQGMDLTIISFNFHVRS
jgi:hypothetical protein